MHERNAFAKGAPKENFIGKIFNCPLRKERVYDPRFAAIVGSIVQSGAQSMIIRHRSRDCGSQGYSARFHYRERSLPGDPTVCAFGIWKAGVYLKLLWGSQLFAGSSMMTTAGQWSECFTWGRI